eukprot:CAMPEP_0206183790 /NCGR_PEP_ID=MMETSP0166-20121206/843_1 /ASSEMBLY_ACC=CAM_ASM_000260 /TAXON_ID=95228 /ORGANISM="Vannella robusta, Strain DIVA3 518/3/11/1/6" /LENGTH=272 /DNA_ID=CAMNT_0053598703 /DNA_START=371 /DNA_END=1186 /DNA_ORIENTATION=+
MPMKTEKETKEPEVIRKVVSKQKVSLRDTLNETFDLVLFSNYEECKGAPLVIGFGDIGITPIITSNSIIEQLELSYIGVLINKQAAPASVITGGQAMHPIRIFGNKEVMVIVADSKMDAKVSVDLVDSLVKLLPYLESKKVFCCEGAPTETTEKMERKELQFVTTSEETADFLIGLNHKALQEAVIAGISGGVLAECTAIHANYDFDTCIFLAPTCSFYPDIWASVLIIQTLSEMLQFKTDTSTLEKNAKKLEDKANELMGLHKGSAAMNSS